MSITDLLLVLIGSGLAGMINTLAGSGSAITLTLLMEVLGLPPLIANATNRVGIFTQSAAGSYAFYRKGKLDVSRSKTYLLFTVLGAIAGVLVSIKIDGDTFREIFKYLMLILLTVILVRPQRWLRETDLDYILSKRWSIPLSVALGFYGGFIQMGMGVFFLVIMVLIARYSLTDANAVKLAVVTIYTGLALLIFHFQSLIDWKFGLLMAIGQTIGGYLTANFAAQSPQANLWAHRILVVVVIAAIIRLFFT